MSEKLFRFPTVRDLSVQGDGISVSHGPLRSVDSRSSYAARMQFWRNMQPGSSEMLTLSVNFNESSHALTSRHARGSSNSLSSLSSMKASSPLLGSPSLSFSSSPSMGDKEEEAEVFRSSPMPSSSGSENISSSSGSENISSPSSSTSGFDSGADSFSLGSWLTKKVHYKKSEKAAAFFSVPKQSCRRKAARAAVGNVLLSFLSDSKTSLLSSSDSLLPSRTQEPPLTSKKEHHGYENVHEYENTPAQIIKGLQVYQNTPAKRSKDPASLPLVREVVLFGREVSITRTEKDTDDLSSIYNMMDNNSVRHASSEYPVVLTPEDRFKEDLKQRKIDRIKQIIEEEKEKILRLTNVYFEGWTYNQIEAWKAQSVHNIMQDAAVQRKMVEDSYKRQIASMGSHPGSQ